ncbi:MAG: hypothetical protein WC162_04470 [Sphaerochaetaceae bacterium]
MIKAILDDVKNYLAQTLGSTVIYDPQPVKQAEPHVRLTFMGSGNQGSLDTLAFQLTLVAAGDGPEVFLEELITLSLKVQDLFSGLNGQGTKDIVKDGRSTRVTFKALENTGSGQFVENEKEDNEQTLFHYTFVEPHIITLSFNRKWR